jgi:hypothetical protein
MKPTLHSHTHCQAAQANATTQAWQRVCLSNRTSKTTDNQADEEEHRSDNTSLAKGGVSYSKDSFVVNQTLVFQIKFCGENRHLCQARKRQAVKKLAFS